MDTQRQQGNEVQSGAQSQVPVNGEDPSVVVYEGTPLDDSKLKSEVWKSFTRRKIGDSIYAYCHYCHTKLNAHSSAHGTTSLKNHLTSCKKNPNRRVVEPNQGLLNFNSATKELTPWHFDQAACEIGLAKMIILDELPYSHVEGEGFRAFMKMSCPALKVPSRHTVMRGVFKLYTSEKQALYDYFKTCGHRVSLTTDTWTSVQQINYMCLTAHFIDHDWVLHKKIINFCPIKSHSGEDIGKGIGLCLQSWSLDKLMTVTVDNATPNTLAVDYLSDQMNMLGTSSLGGEFMHMRCIAHIINLVVQEGLKDIATSVEKIRYAVKFIRMSPIRLQRFADAVKQAKIDGKKLLSADMPTRWNSTYLMLKSACRLEKAFGVYDIFDPTLGNEMGRKKIRDKDNKTTLLGRITPHDWVECRCFLTYLKLFYNMTVRISGSYYATSNNILDDICDLYTHIEKGLIQENIDMQSMARRMLEKFNKYFGTFDMLNLYTFLAPIFDPRKKMDFVSFAVNKMYSKGTASKLMSVIERALNDLFGEYTRAHGTNTSNAPVMDSDSGPIDLEVESMSDGATFAAYKRRKHNQEGTAKSELERYLKEEEAESTKKFDVLVWWSQNAARYPIISRMARDILAIPVSTVSSESAFSTGRRVLTDFRSSLHPNTVQALICTQDWFKMTVAKDPTVEDMTPMARAAWLVENMEKLQLFEEDLVQNLPSCGVPIIM